MTKKVRLLKMLFSCFGNEINVKEFQDSQQKPDMFEYFVQIYQTSVAMMKCITDEVQEMQIKINI